MADPPGYSLGGSATPLSPEEIRRRRLAAFEGSEAASPSAANPFPTPMEVTPAPVVDEDAELQAALALSMQDIHQPASVETKNSIPESIELGQQKPPPSTMNTTSASPAVHHKPVETPDWVHTIPTESFSLSTFQSVMWDDQITTPHDKERWVLSGIDVRSDPNVVASNLYTNHDSWGLAQQHGGPCGVLAAVQAEMLRVLLDDHQSSSSSSVGRVLARAMAVSLARAALTPPVDNTTTTTTTSTGMVKIVLPCHDGWKMGFLDPSIAASDTTTTLQAHTMPADDATSGASTVKRQKLDASLFQQIDRLADRLVPFLFHHLDAFRQPGGVLLLVMSLVATRPHLADEFDDSMGTKLTAQFGHCGQELMNLLLTGQATSNVFDNTLSPSGDMVCHGVQSRPMIGYLSQLEALRYCEVGSYYKSPVVPIWVVGSTSHFTVLFGEKAALKESKSDVLLEECRRAFKSMEGGEENGFIQSAQLGLVLEKLNIKLGGDEVSRAQTLAASLEVGGAGIILWDDFWRSASRLMTGASLETVLQGGNGASPNNAIIIADTAPPPPATIVVPPANETDEEMARRLNAEWSGMAVLSAAAESVADEEYARKLQATLDDGGGENESTAAVVDEDDMDRTSLAGLNINTTEQTLDSKLPPADSKPEGMEFEQYGDTFSLYHYNGLREGVLTPLKITRLTPVEAVGASIALHRSGAAAGAQDLEDVLRTKWPSCTIDWMGKRPPYID